MKLPWLLAVAIILAPATVIRAQSNWIPDAQSATRENLWGIAYGNNALIAVGERGTILFSDYDGAPWQPRYTESSDWLLAVAFANGRWIVVGDGGTILVSDDGGDSWNARASPTTARLNAVAYGNGRWLAVGESGTVITSVEGDTWEARPSLSGGFLRALAFGDGRFLLGGAFGRLYSTTDAVTFAQLDFTDRTQENRRITNDIEAIAIVPGRVFVAGSRLLAVSQAAQWEVSVNTPRTFRGLAAFSRELAVAAGDLAAWDYASNVWAGASSTPPTLITNMVSAKDEFVAVGFGGHITRSSWSQPVSFDVSGQFQRTTINAIYGAEVRLKIRPKSDLSAESLQWMHDRRPIPGATTLELVLRDVRPSDAGDYWLQFSGNSSSPSRRLRVVPGGRPEVINASFNSVLPYETFRAHVQPDWKLLATTNVVSTDGSEQVTTQLVRLNADGSIDPTFRPTISGGGAYSVHVDAQGRIYITGPFTSVAGERRAGFARLQANGELDRSFVPAISGMSDFVGPIFLPDGRFYVQNGGVVLRLLPDGTRDPSFTVVSDDVFVGVDSAGRVLTQKFVSGPPAVTFTRPSELRRYNVTGNRDLAFVVTLSNTFRRVFSGDAFFGMESMYGHFGGTSGFFKLTADGRRDPTYIAPPGTPYPDFENWAGFYRPDGGVWDLRNSTRGWSVRSYAPSGALERERYANMIDSVDFTHLATGPDGSLYVKTNERVASTGALPRSLVCIRPITGQIGRLTNLSVRAHAPSAAEPLIAGFVTLGTGTTRALVRAIGPGLDAFNVANAMPDPRITLARGSSIIASNDDWPENLAVRFSDLGAFPLGRGSRDAALETDITAGDYSAIVTPAATGGTVLLELYESSEIRAPRRFVNVSARGPVAPGQPLIVGFSISGDVPIAVLIRGAGPALGRVGITRALADPQLTLFRGNVALWDNDNWSSVLAEAGDLESTTTQIGAFPFERESKDAVMLVTLAPGNYTAQVGTAGTTSGIALVEVYEVP